MPDRHATEPEKQASVRRGEMAQFLLLAFGIWPIAAVAFVGGYGFLVWIYQMIAGPPGPSGH